MEKKIGGHGILANLAKTPYGAVYLLRTLGGEKLLCHQVLLHKVRPPELRGLEPLIAASLAAKHENLLSCREVERTSKAWNLIYDFFSEQSLPELLRARPLAWDARLRIIRQIREVVKYFDARGELHSHLRARNFLAEERSGGVKALDAVVATLQTMYARAEDVEEFRYWPPEELHGAAATAKGDVWSVALVVWEVAFGPDAFPFDTRSKEGFLRTLELPAPAAQTHNADLADLLARSLRADPAQRLSREEFYLHPFFTGRSRSPTPPRSPNRFSTRAEDRAPYFLQSLHREQLRRQPGRSVAVRSFDFYRDRVFEFEVVARTVRANLALITHNWQRQFLQFYRGLTLVVLNKTLLQADNLQRSLRERINHYRLADFVEFLGGREEPRLVALAAEEAHRALKDLDDAVFADLAQTALSKNYADEVREKIFRHLADEEEYRRFALETHRQVKKAYREAVEARQVAQVRHALHLYEYVLAGRVMENLEEF